LGKDLVLYLFYYEAVPRGTEIEKEGTAMNTIKIKGYASRKANADRIRYTIGFVSKDVKASRASEQVKKQCDVFLKNMKELGFDVSKFHLDGDIIEKEYNKEEKKAKRTVSFELPFDPKINNAIYTIIRKEDLNVETQTGFFLSDRNRLHNELLKEALLDSKRKAELIAEANNQKVKYAELISDNKYDADYDKDFDDSDLRCGDVCGIVLDDDSLSAELSARQIEEYANLYVTWVIE